MYLAINKKSFKVYLEDENLSSREKKSAIVGCGDNGHFLDTNLLDDMNFNSTEFRIAMKLHLGFPVYSIPDKSYIPCPCCKDGGLDKYGDHAIVCAGQNDCSTRHNAVRDRLASAAIDGQFSPVIEKKGCSC